MDKIYQLIPIQFSRIKKEISLSTLCFFDIWLCTNSMYQQIKRDFLHTFIIDNVMLNLLLCVYLLMLILGRNTGSVGSGMALVTACARVSSWRWSEHNCEQEPGPASSCGHRPQLGRTKLLSPHRAAADARFHSGLVTSYWCGSRGWSLGHPGSVCSVPSPRYRDAGAAAARL